MRIEPKPLACGLHVQRLQLCSATLPFNYRNYYKTPKATHISSLSLPLNQENLLVLQPRELFSSKSCIVHGALSNKIQFLMKTRDLHSNHWDMIVLGLQSSVNHGKQLQLVQTPM
jgi:hypothetical protein